VLQAPSYSMVNINQIAGTYDTDKADNAQYLRNYEEFFRSLLDKEIRLLELGIHRGGSLLLWRDYFQKGLIVGLDINPVLLHDESGRIRTYQGMQQDTGLLDRIARETAPEGFDVIIDDCSHIGMLSRVTFWHLFDLHLKSGGIYVIEDWGTGYWDTWVDGVRYRPHSQRYSPSVHFISRAITWLQINQIMSCLPLVSRLLAGVKAVFLKGQYHSHDFGMVGFIKELIDELGMKDITNPEFGVPPHRQSKFREMRISPSHLFIFKS
jgi:hypothetical protein